MNRSFLAGNEFIELNAQHYSDYTALPKTFHKGNQAYQMDLVKVSHHGWQKR